jgi:hypothetical protein
MLKPRRPITVLASTACYRIIWDIRLIATVVVVVTAGLTRIVIEFHSFIEALAANKRPLGDEHGKSA